MSMLPEDRASRTAAATLAGVLGVVLSVSAFVQVILMALGRIEASTPAVAWIGGLGLAGGYLLTRFLHLDWRRDLAESPGGDCVLRGQFQFGSLDFPGWITRQGTVAVQGDALVLRYRTGHHWAIFVLSVLTMVTSDSEPGSPLVFLLLAVMLGLVVAWMIPGRRNLPFADIRLAVVQTGKILLFHGAVGKSSESILHMDVRPLRALRELLAARAPVEVLPPPARPRRPGAPAVHAPVPPSPRPPGTALDGRKVNELDRAMKGLRRLNDDDSSS